MGCAARLFADYSEGRNRESIRAGMGIDPLTQGFLIRALVFPEMVSTMKLFWLLKVNQNLHINPKFFAFD